MVWVGQDGGTTAPNRGPVSMSGAMTVGGYGSITVDRGSRYEENRSARGNGTIELYLPDSDLAGKVTMEFSASLLQPSGSAVPDVVHSWGTAIAAFGATTCRGSTALSHFRRYPEEGSGTLQLLCDDRSAFAADVVITRMGDSLDFDLRDGWYVPAERA